MILMCSSGVSVLSSVAIAHVQQDLTNIATVTPEVVQSKSTDTQGKDIGRLPFKYRLSVYMEKLFFVVALALVIAANMLFILPNTAAD